MKIQMISIFIISLIFFGCGLSDSEKLQQPGLKENKALSILENSNQLTKDDLTLAVTVHAPIVPFAKLFIERFGKI
jgi:hypothetical protein